MMRTLVAALLLVLGFGIATVPAGVAETVTETETFHTHGPVCTEYEDEELDFVYQVCLDGKHVLHVTYDPEDGSYNILSHTDYDLDYEFSSGDCADGGQLSSRTRQHAISQGDDEGLQVEHFHALYDHKFTFRCALPGGGEAHYSVHCVGMSFFHFANGEFQIDRSTYECTPVPIA